MSKLDPLNTMYDILPNGCWIWKGKLIHGYGRIEVYGVTFPAHVVVYRHYKKGFDYRLELDHTCKNKACVNPDHLEPVTHKENLRRNSIHRFELIKEKIKIEYMGGRPIEEMVKEYAMPISKITSIGEEMRWE